MPTTPPPYGRIKKTITMHKELQHMPGGRRREFPGQEAMGRQLHAHPGASHAVPSEDGENRFFAREGVNPLTSAFKRKIAVHPGLGGRQVSPDEKGPLLDELSQKKIEGKAVAYIHVPFCETRCLYCGFYRNPYKQGHSRIFTDALIAELALWRKRQIQNSGPFHAIYFGGGTPTALEAQDIKRLLKATASFLPLANDCEITVEGRVSNLTEEKIEAMLEGGANRFSLGVQSFNTQIRQAMGRRSTREEAISRLQLLQSYDQSAILVDLIYGFPMQTMDIWLKDIADAQALNLDGADCYQLNIYDASPLASSIKNGNLPEGADIPGQALMFEAGIAAMENAFYRRLSISHWGRTTRERNIYNQYVKGNSHCLSFGPGGGGTLHGHFYFNQPDYQAWLDLVAKGEKPVAMLQRPGENARFYRAVAEGMEQARFELGLLEAVYGLELSATLSPLLQQWERAGLVRPLPCGGFTLTVAGQFWQVNLTQLLIEYLNQCL